MDLAAISDQVYAPDETSRAAAQDRLQALPPIGRLGELAVWLAGVHGRWPLPPINRPRLVLLAADHGIAAAGVSTQPPGATMAAVREIAASSGPVGVLAAAADVGVRVIDIAVDGDLSDAMVARVINKVRPGSGRIDVEDAMSVDEADRAVAAGMAAADAEIDEGADLLLLGTIGVGATTPASALIGVLTTVDAAAVTGRGSGIDDRAWMRKCAAIRDAMRRARPVVTDRLRLLAVAGGADLAAATGFLLQAAIRRTPVVLDGLPVVASALVAQRIAYRAVQWWLPGHPLVAEPSYGRALQRLSLAPAVDYGANLPHGGGALLALPVLRTAIALVSGAE